MMVPEMGAQPQPQMQPQPQEAMSPSGGQDTFEILIDVFLEMWRQTGGILGRPVQSEEEAVQIAVQMALEHLQQAQAQTQPQMQAQAQAQGVGGGGGAENPMMQALMGMGGGGGMGGMGGGF